MHFFGCYVPAVYGVRRIRAWLNENKGSTFLDMMTMSDVAFCIMLVHNNIDVWKQDAEIKSLPYDQREKYKTKNWKKLPEKEKSHYLRVLPKFTKRAGVRKVARETGFTKAGQDFYNEALKNWKEMSNYEVGWQELEVGWEQYVQTNGFIAGEWRLREDETLDAASMGGEDEEIDDPPALPSLGLTLLGDEDFERERTWKVNPRRVSDEGGAVAAGRVEPRRVSNESDAAAALAGMGRATDDGVGDEEEEDGAGRRAAKRSRRGGREAITFSDEANGSSSSDSD